MYAQLKAVCDNPDHPSYGISFMTSLTENPSLLFEPLPSTGLAPVDLLADCPLQSLADLHEPLGKAAADMGNAQLRLPVNLRRPIPRAILKLVQRLGDAGDMDIVEHWAGFILPGILLRAAFLDNNALQTLLPLAASMLSEYAYDFPMPPAARIRYRAFDPPTGDAPLELPYTSETIQRYRTFDTDLRSQWPPHGNA